MTRSLRPLRFLGLIFCLGLAACGDEPTPSGPRDLRGLDAAALESLVGAFNQGVGQMDRFEAKAAIPHFERVVELAPDWATGRLNLGIALLNAERKELYVRAEEELRQAMRLAPEDPRPAYALGMLVTHQQRYEIARDLFTRVLELDPHDPDTHFQLGSLLMDLDPAKARVHLRAAYEGKPHHENACYRLFQLLREAGEIKQAEALIERFRALKQTGAGEPSAIKYGEMGRYADIVRAFGTPDLGAETHAPPTYVNEAAARGLDLTADTAGPGPGVAVSDVNGDGLLDLYVAATSPGAVGRLYLGAKGKFALATDHGLTALGVTGACFGDYDRDGDPDLYLTRPGANVLYRNDGAGVFEDVTEASQAGGGEAWSVAPIWADADHDGDLDIFIVNQWRPGKPGQAWIEGAKNVLLRNDGKGTFVDIAEEAGVDGGNATTLSAAFFDADGDRDLDLYVIHRGAANQLFLNGRVGIYREAKGPAFAPLLDAPGVASALVADLDGNGLLDLLLSGPDAIPLLVRQEQRAVFRVDRAFAQHAEQTGNARGALVGDLDLDGHTDLVLLAPGLKAGRHVALMNRGNARFAAPVALGSVHPRASPRGAVAVDFDRNGTLELLIVHARGPAELLVTAPPKDRHWLTVLPGGAPDGGKGPRPGTIGLSVEVKTGRHTQTTMTTSLMGALGGMPAEAHFGLGTRAKADYVRLTWPDAVLQSELEVGGDQVWRVAKVERKPSSCPLLFAWDGERFAYVTDFLGVGGCGFFVEPGVYAPPDPTEAVRIPPALIKPKNGHYLLRVAEPLEEVTYLDELHLRVYDHPSDMAVFPDERFAALPPFPTAAPRTVSRRVFPKQATDHHGNDVTARLLSVDRQYVVPPVDPRYIGYAEEHFVELDFRGRVPTPAKGERLVLFLHGWVEYTYSHVNFAAWQAGIVMQSPRLEIPDGHGGWKTAIEDAGFPAGLPRMMTVDVTDVPLAKDGRLRLRTNMEIFWDQAFLGIDRGAAGLVEHRLLASKAELRFLGYPREFSPDGNVPTAYDYARIDPGLPYKLMAGAYTRFGDVRPLLAKTDDQFVVLGRGEEVMLDFDATGLPKLRPGYSRTVVLYSDGYCKDMDLYTAYPDTVGPLPFHAMQTYPPKQAPPPDNGWQARWNTRIVRDR